MSSYPRGHIVLAIAAVLLLPLVTASKLVTGDHQVTCEGARTTCLERRQDIVENLATSTSGSVSILQREVQMLRSGIRDLKVALSSCQQRVDDVALNISRLQGESNANPIAFQAFLGSTLETIGHHQTIVYSRVITNVGGAYNGHTGIFTCPRRGLYGFSWTSVAKPGAHLDTFLIVDGEEKGRATSGYPNGWNSGSKLVTVSLEEGDLVWIRKRHGSYLLADWYSSFSGWSV